MATGRKESRQDAEAAGRRKSHLSTRRSHWRLAGFLTALVAAIVTVLAIELFLFYVLDIKCPGYRPEHVGLCYPGHDYIALPVLVRREHVLFAGLPGWDAKLRVSELKVLDGVVAGKERNDE